MSNIKFMILLVLLLEACTFQTKHRGYIFPSDLENRITTIKNVKQLENEIGSPQTSTIYGKKVLIYYSVDENYRGPFPFKYDNKTVLLVWPDKKGNIVKTDILHDSDLPVIKISNEETQIPAEIKLNAFEELFKNVGRFSPSGM